MLFESSPLDHARARSLLLWVAVSLLVLAPPLGWLSARSGFQDPQLLVVSLHLHLTLLAWVAWQVHRAGAGWGFLLGPVRERRQLSGVLLGIPLLLFALSLVWALAYLRSALDPDYVPGFLLPDPAAALPAGPLYTVLFALEVAVLAPVAEELGFRGVLLHRWGSKWGLVPGMLASSLAFAVLHRSILDALVFGLVMAMLYLRARTLLIPIGAHALNNLIAFSLRVVDQNTGDLPTGSALDRFRAYGWLAALCLAVSLWLVVRHLRRSLPELRWRLPA